MKIHTKVAVPETVCVDRERGIYRVGQKKRSKFNCFINAKIIVCYIQFMDHSSINVMSERGPKDISIA